MIVKVLKISTIACLELIVFMKEILINYFYVSTIHLLLLKQKYEISTVDCTKIKDLYNLCVRPTIDYLQVNNLS